MMIEEGKKKGIKFIQLRDSEAVLKIYEYLKSEGMKVSKPSIENIEGQVKEISKKYNEEYEDIKIVKKAKELVGKR
jgi:rRNA maturation endonuclease Nob1